MCSKLNVNYCSRKVKANDAFNNGHRVKRVVNYQYSGEGLRRERDLEMNSLQFEEFHQISETFNEPAVPMFICKFCQIPQYSNIVVAADENGYVLIHNIKEKKATAVVQAHDNAVFDLSWVPQENKFLTLSGDHTARLWDCGESDIKLVSIFGGHSKSVKTADFRPNDPAIFATGSRDGCVMIWDSRSKSKLCPHLYKSDQVITRAAADQCKTNKKASITSVTAVVYQDENNLVCAGSNDAYIRIYDMRKTYSISKGNEPKNRLKAKRSGFADLKLNPSKTKLYASCLNSSIFCFNLNSCSSNPIAEYCGHQTGSFYVKTCVSSDGEYLLSGSSDKLVHIWKTKEGERLSEPCNSFLKLESHVAEVTAVDINQKGFTTVVSCADDGTLRKWRPVFFKDGTEPQETEGIRFNLESLNLMENRREETLATDEQMNELNEVDTLNSNGNEDTSLAEQTPAVLMTPAAKPANFEAASSKRKIRDMSPSLNFSPDSKRIVLSPKKNNSEYHSPTLNLPNYVLDGTGPHHRCSRSHQKENTDWLTKMRKSSSKSVDRIGDRRNSSEKRSDGRGRKLDFGASNGNKKRTPNRTLLQYYKKSSKATDETSQKSG